MILTEHVLEDYAICPLLEQADLLSVVESCARELAKWTLLEAFNGRVIPAATLRFKFVKFWNDMFGDRPHEGDDYWEGPRVARVVARCLFQLVSKYEVLRPIEPYRFTLDGHEIQGRYALLKTRSMHARDQRPIVLVLHMKRRLHMKQPDVVSLARFCAEMRRCEHIDVCVYHLPLLSGSAWIHEGVNEALAQQWLRSILDMAVNQRVFPAPGGHCSSCVTRKCLKVFNV